MKTYNRDVNLAAGARLLKDGTVLIDADGNIDAPVTTTTATFSGNTTIGDASGDTLTVNATSTVSAPLTVGVDDTGYDVKLFGATSGAYALFDESADTLKTVGGYKINAQGTVTVGVDDTGYDVQLFGATASSHLLWDESADTLKLVGAAKLDVAGTTALQGATTVTAGAGIVSTVATATVPFIIGAAQETASPAAALSLATHCSLLNSTAGATTQTLADSTVLGQLKRIQLIVDGGDDVVTLANGVGGNTLTFADVGDVAELMWNGSGWVPIALYNCADGATAPTLTTV